MLDRIPDSKRRNIASYELLWEFGRQLRDKHSLLYTAQETNGSNLLPWDIRFNAGSESVDVQSTENALH